MLNILCFCCFVHVSDYELQCTIQLHEVPVHRTTSRSERIKLMHEMFSDNDTQELETNARGVQ